MASKSTASERRSQVAQACMDFGTRLMKLRLSSLTPEDAKEAVTDLFDWFEKEEAFSDGNYGIAIKALDFGEELLASRKTATVQEAVETIRELYSRLAEK